MQTYVFVVVVNGEDVQDDAERLRESVITLARATEEEADLNIDVHVTESMRVTKA